MKNGKMMTIFVIAVIALGSIGLNSIYTINTGEEAVIQRFGKHIDTIANPGINFKIPFVDQKTIIDVNSVHRMEFGFVTVDDGKNSDGMEFSDDFTASKMLTGDENIAIVEAIIQYQIKNSSDYLFRVDDIDGTLRTVSESTIRRVVANHTLDEALTENKSGIQTEILEDLQQICDKYECGIKIVGVQLQDVNPPQEVDAAFRDVAGAREDKNSYINEANAYKNEVIPTARGEAASLTNEAQAYATNRVESANASVTAYEQLYEEYLNGTEVTRSRMYLEALQEVLKGVEIYIMDDQNGMKLFNMK
ncbi:MAG: FtsH protease activity modulator HflK [Oscillospiraceae bacterium]